MAEQNIRGRFVWHDLMTPNRDGAVEFYSAALGWRASPWEEEPSYVLFAAPGGAVGGALEQPAGTPHWLPFIGTDDLDATAREAERLGGSVRTGPTDLPNTGRFAILADPHGASFGLYWSASPSEPGAGIGQFSWHELATADCREAFEFYRALFGWEQVAEHDMGPEGIYLIFGRDGSQWGGMYNKRDQGKPGPAYWLGYVEVDDLDAAVERITRARGSVLVGPMEVPGGDRIAQLSDPHGALFAVHERRTATATEPAARDRSVRAAVDGDERQAATTKGRAKRKTAKKKATRTKTAKKKTARKAVGKKAAKKAAKKSAKKTARKKPAAKRGKESTKARGKRTAKKPTKKPSTKKPAKTRGKPAAARKSGGTSRKARTKKANRRPRA